MVVEGRIVPLRKRPAASPLQMALDSRADLRLLGEFLPSGCSLRPLAHNGSDAFPYSLLHDRLLEDGANRF